MKARSLTQDQQVHIHRSIYESADRGSLISYAAIFAVLSFINCEPMKSEPLQEIKNRQFRR